MTWQERRAGKGGQENEEEKRRCKDILTTSDRLISGLTWHVLCLRGLL